MSDVERTFHGTWLGMVQPVEGLVVSVPVLIDAQCMQRQPPEVQAKLAALCPPTRQGAAGPEGYTIADVGQFFEGLLDLTPDLFDSGDALPEELSLYVAEGRQTLRPSMGLKKLEGSEAVDREGSDSPIAADATPASTAGAKYVALVWDLEAVAKDTGHPGQGVGLDLDKPETVTGPWDYPPAAKLDRLLRHARVPIGILTNREVLRLVYAPHGESSGHITFKLDDLAMVGGRPMLDALCMLLSSARFFGVAKEHALPALLSESRKRQANVTNELAEQVFQALSILLAGFEAASERDGRDLLDDALARDNDHLYKGLLTVLLRLVFVLYAEDRGVLPTEHPVYSEHLSVLGLFERLQEEAGAHPDSMSRRFGAWGQLVSLFRAVFLGVEHGDMHMPARRGALFDPNTYPFLEGWGPAGGAPIVMAEHRAEVRVPTVDDETVFRVLEKLIVFEGQRLSYRTLDVEQIGSVYEALMGYHVVRVPAAAVCMKPNGVWLGVDEALEVPAGQRGKWLKEEIGLSKAQAEKLASALKTAKGEHAPIDALAEYAKGSRKADKAIALAKAGQLVLQPGAERRRTSSHYTPRSLSAPIVRRTIEPLLACMGAGSAGTPRTPGPPSDQILELKICDPAMGSGAFLVEACRFLGDHLVAAWTREGKLEEIAKAAPNEDPTLHARRLVAQRCLYGVDKNESAVELAKLSLWLVTLAKDMPFTFIDHALRHGDSLVGLSFDQIKAFHWKPGKQVHLAEQVLQDALDEAIGIRQRILALAEDGSAEGQREKKRLLEDAGDACDRARLIGDVVVGAFFAEQKGKARETERLRRLGVVQRWLAGDGEAEAELRGLQAEILARLPVFHWMLEYPEVFCAERPDPLDDARVNRVAFLDALVGNPPFLGGSTISTNLGDEYFNWLNGLTDAEGGQGRADLSAYFFRRADSLLGSNGTLGLVATNTIAQGDSRGVGLRFLVSRRNHRIIHATSTMFWPGEAAVAVAMVHTAVGAPTEPLAGCILDGRPCQAINSRLRPRPERAEAVALRSNASLSFKGVFPLGGGFVLTRAQADELLATEPAARQILFPYVGGQDLNQSPTQSSEELVINFGQRSLEEVATNWPVALQRIRRLVKPERDKLRDTSDGRRYKARWWQFGRPSPGLFDAIDGLARYIVTARVTKHLCFTFQSAGPVPNEKIYVLRLTGYTQFAILQSRVHVGWTWLVSSTLKADLNYSASDCFETFPFPQPDPTSHRPALVQVGEHLYETHADYMIETQQGLTQTYNKLKDPAFDDGPIAHLRRLHEEMDRAVLDAYGWSDIEVPPFCPATPAEEKALEAFSDEVIDRLFVLNAERAEEERLKGLGDGKKGKQVGRTKKAAKTEPSGQATLDFDD